MLTEFLIRDETICSLGTTEHTFTVHHLGTTIRLSVWLDLIHRAVEVVFHPGTSVPFLNSFHSSVDRKKSP